MTTQLVLRVVGPDRPGLVSALADVVAEQGGNWLQSQLARLAGTFAGIVMVDLPSGNVSNLEDAIRRLDDQGLLDVAVTAASWDSDESDSGSTLSLHLIGQDHPGIVREVTKVLADQRVSILLFETDVFEAPQAGGRMFEATIDAVIPASTDADSLGAALESLAAELMVDLSLED